MTDRPTGSADHLTHSFADPAATTGGDLAPAAGPSPARSLRYVLGDEIARGGMGVVYRAADTALGREVAVKVLADRYGPDSGAARRFADEARITGRLQHPGIPPVHDLGTLPDGRPFLAMKLIAGDTLDALLGRGPDPGRLVAAFEAVCQAVGYAHSRGVIHRDLKPANVMVGAFGEVQVMDWGLAKVLTSRGVHPPGADDDSDATADLADPPPAAGAAATRAGSVLGTPAYMPPEQAVGAVDQVDRRSDVFGLGGILCAALTGKPPFVGDTAESTRQLAARGRLADCFARLDGCGADPELVALCKRCLAPEPADRPADAGEVAAAVAALRAAADDRARRAELDRVKAEGEKAAADVRAAEQRRRGRLRLALMAAVGLLAATAGAFGWWADRQAGERERAANEQRAADLRRELEDGQRAAAERDRLGRNADAVGSLLDQAAAALRAGDAVRAGALLAAADARRAEGGADHLAARAAGLRADLAALHALIAVDRFRWTPVDGVWPDGPAVVERYRSALAGAGADPDAIPPEAAAARVAGSAVRDRLVAALDRMLWAERSARVRDALRRADPNPFRDAVRDLVIQVGPWTNKLGRLAADPAAAAHPPGFVALLGETPAVPFDRRRELLILAAGPRPTDLTLLMALGSAETGAGPGAAERRARWYQAAVAAAPDNPDARHNLGIALREAGDLRAAEVALREAARLDPKDPWPHANLAWVLHDRRDFAGAVAAFEPVMRLASGSNKFQREFGRLLSAAGDPDRAAAHFREALRLDPGDVDSLSGLGVALRRKRDLDGAADAFRAAIRLAPDRAAPRADLAQVLDLKGDPAGAAAAYRDALARDPAVADWHNRLGLVLLRTGDPAGAEACFREAVRRDPKYVPGHNNLGNVLRDRGDPAAAADCYREALRHDPKDAISHNNLGVALRQLGDPDGAVAAYREAVKLNPKYVTAHTNLGISLRAKGELAAAAACYREALKHDPRYALAHNGLGAVLDQAGDRDGAEACFREAVRLNPRDPVARANLGKVLGKAGDWAGAAEAYREAVRLNPKKQAYADALGAALAKAGPAPATAPPPRPVKR